MVATGLYGRQIYEPVFKQRNSLEGVHPCKRLRLVSKDPVEPEIISQLINIVRGYCNLIPDAQGLLEFEFIHDSEEIYFLELNPRLAATMRMVSMAAWKNPFCEIVQLSRVGKEGGTERVPCERFAGEIPCRDLDAETRTQIESLGEVSISSRVTLVASTSIELRRRIRQAQEILSIGKDAERRHGTSEALISRTEIVSPEPLVIDLDLNYPSDDFQSLLLVFASNQFDILGCTAVAGNTWMEEVYVNTRTALSAIGKEATPVFRGNLYTTYTGNTHFALDSLRKGVNPFVGAYAKSKRPRLPDAVLDRVSGRIYTAPRTIISFSEEYRGRLTILATGPLTNINEALRRNPNLPDCLKKVVFMGGHFGPTSASGRTDFNVWFDAPSAAEVFTSRVPLTVVPLEVCHLARSSQDLLHRVSRTGRKGVAKLFAHDFEMLSRQHGDSMALCDQLAALILIDESIIKDSIVGRITVDASMTDSRGKTSFQEDSTGNVRLIREVDVTKAHNLLLSLVDKLNETPSRELQSIEPVENLSFTKHTSGIGDVKCVYGVT